MFERLKSVFSGGLLAGGEAAIEDEFVAPTAAAMLLLEIAWADQDILEQEMADTRNALVELFALPSTRAEQIVAAARRAHETSISMYPFTRTVNDALSPDEKKHLLVCCWRLALADSRIDRHEEYTIRRIAELLYLSHEDFIAAKLAAKAANG
jgi:uncharacterized tellurite resistance protein B-like protein